MEQRAWGITQQAADSRQPTVKCILSKESLLLAARYKLSADYWILLFLSLEACAFCRGPN